MNRTLDKVTSVSSSDQFEELIDLLDFAQANLQTLMASGQKGEFLVDHETVINSIWSVSDGIERAKQLVSEG